MLHTESTHYSQFRVTNTYDDNKWHIRFGNRKIQAVNSPIASAFRVRNSEFMFSIRKATKAEVQVTETCGRYLYALQLENTKFNLLSPEKVNFSLGLW